jgi:ribosomal protein S18 acetylase RimI-like enzyme
LDLHSDYSTKELDLRTWPDFESLFEKYGGVQAGCWCMYYQRAHPLPKMSWDSRVRKNRLDKKVLIERGLSHGIIVYFDKEPIGWCQYGEKEELPRIDSGRNYKKLMLPSSKKGKKKLWRITCFFVDKGHRRRGVSQIALKAALRSIKEKGGGIVESYPATNMRAVAIWFGTIAMFRREGFTKVAVLGRSNFVMRKSV